MLRAEPVSALYEQEKVFHTKIFPQLEDQMCSYTGDSRKSPDRLDALVWALTELSSSSRKPLWRIS
jgi:phage terminase large subunit-like protein